MRVELPTVADTLAFGERLGRRLRAGDLVLLAGPLGAGKTVLVRGIAMDAAVVVEWGEGVAEALSADHLLIRLSRRDDDVRSAVLVPHGSWVDREIVVCQEGSSA